MIVLRSMVRSGLGRAQGQRRVVQNDGDIAAVGSRRLSINVGAPSAVLVELP